MKILFNDIMKDATLSVTNGSSNYPIENIANNKLTKRFQSTSTLSLITATYSEDQCCDCLFYAYHNLTGLTAVFKDSLGATIDTVIVSEIQDIGVEYFTQIDNIRSIEITITGAVSFYIGGVGLGCCYDVPDILVGYQRGFKDNSLNQGSAYGQKENIYIKPLRTYSWGFKAVNLDEFIEQYVNNGVGKHCYIDIFENSRETEAPIYATIEAPLSTQIDYRFMSNGLRIEEAR